MLPYHMADMATGTDESDVTQVTIMSKAKTEAERRTKTRRRQVRVMVTTVMETVTVIMVILITLMVMDMATVTDHTAMAIITIQPLLKDRRGLALFHVMKAKCQQQVQM
jgi:hypothetical protein